MKKRRGIVVFCSIVRSYVYNSVSLGMYLRGALFSPMNQLINIKISVKLTLITVATTATALLCVLVAFFVQDLKLVKQIKAEQIETQLSILSGNLAYALMQDDLKTVDTLLVNASSEYGIVYAVVYDELGRPLSRYRRTDNVEQGIKTVSKLLSFSVLPFARDIKWQGAVVASLIVDISYADVEIRLLYLIGYSAMAFIFALGIAVVVAWFIQRQVSEPLLRLHRLSQDVIETGNYSLRADVVSNDELGQLGDAFNRMLTQIENRDAMMEKRVNQRTRELQKLAEDFRYRALHDSLTGLPNRAFLNEEFHRAVAHAKRVGKNFAVLMLDLDNFKDINDSCGHHAGDELLKLVASKLRGALRGGDIVCRLGGDEFIALLEGVQDIDHIQSVANGCLFDAFKDEIVIADRFFRVGFSVGASLYPQHGEGLAELKRNADTAMYRAKEAGKNRLEIYDPYLDRQNFDRKTLQNELEGAVTRNELFLEYQPQVNTEEQTLVGCEAFVRWMHPQYGLILPEDFLSFAEEDSSIQEIDYFAIEEACRQCQEWRLRCELTIPVSVNVSSFHFRSNDLAHKVKGILHATGLAPHMLTLEFSESALVNKSSMADLVVESLREMGVNVALGHFAGYCSLSHLGLLNIDSIKLSQSLFRSVVYEQREQRLIKGLLAFSKELDIQLIVEGVEQYEQIPVLQALGCLVVQGYVYSKPLPKAVFLHWFDQFQLNLQSPALGQAGPKELMSDMEPDIVG